MFAIGVVPPRGQQPAALAVIEAEPGHAGNICTLRHLEEFPKDAQLIQVAQHTIETAKALRYGGTAPERVFVTVEAGSLGSEGMRLWNSRGHVLSYVEVVSGHRQGGSPPPLSRLEIIERLRLGMERRSFRVSKKLPIVDTFLSQLGAMQEKPPRNDPTVIDPRDQPAEHLVLAVGMALDEAMGRRIGGVPLGGTYTIPPPSLDSVWGRLR